MSHIYWVGVRKSDLISLDSLYYGSITFFGDGKDNNVCLFKEGVTRKNHNIDLELFTEFNKASMLQILEDDPDALFMFYNQIYAYSFEEKLREKIICLNSLNILKTLNNKILCKSWLNNSVCLLKNIEISGEKICLEYLRTIFGNIDDYIIQLPVSSGGTGTYILNQYNFNEVVSKLDSSKLYTVAPYYKNAISLNVHCVIYENTFQIYPYSLQIIKEENYNLLYKGCDFISVQELNPIVTQKLEIQTNKICEKLLQSHYRGVCGIDFMLIKDDIYFCEINPRFQASTIALNMALAENNYMSVNEATIYSFTKALKTDSHKIHLEVGYSSYAYDEMDSLKIFHKNIFNRYFEHYPEYKILQDGYTFDAVSESGSYLFRTIFPHPITKISGNEVYVNEIIAGYTLNNPSELIQLKIMLLNFGIRISSDALSHIENSGHLQEANFSAIDIILWDDFIINCPYNINYTYYSPFVINLDHNNLVLYYVETPLTQVNIYHESSLNYKCTSSGVPYYAVAFLATDRLRINYNPVCYYKSHKIACLFCNLPDKNCYYKFEDIAEIVNDFVNNENFRHILLGGGSSNPSSNFSEIIQLATFLKKITNKPLYLMSTPPNNPDVLYKLHDAGISEIAFNIEIFDPELAKLYMPGKSIISREHYYETLEMAVSLWGKEGNVRSMIILGLEPEESVLAGIEKLCKIGVQPMLSIFRPLKDTPLYSYMPPATEVLLEQYKKIKSICQKYNQNLGPTCIFCQNNTLSIPEKFEAYSLNF